MGLSKEDKSAIIKFCEDHHIKLHIGWKNFTGSVSLPETLVLDIETEQQASDLAKLILKLNRKKSVADTITYRAGAAGQNSGHKDDRYDRKSYSMTPIMEADILLHLVGPQFHKIDVLDKDNYIVKVGVSIPIGDLDKRLDVDYGMNLPTSSLIPHITIGGAVATGVHGTGRDHPSVAGLVRSIRILRPDGAIETIDEKHPDFKTILGSHLGLFGIVLDMEIQCRKAMRMEFIVKTTNMAGYMQAVKEGLYRDNEYVSEAWFPEGQKDEGAKDAQKDVVLICWKPVPHDTPLSGSCEALDKLGQKVTIFLQEAFHINALLKKHPHLIPLFKKYFVTPLEVTGQDKKIVVPWYEGAHYQVAFPHDIVDEDLLFPVSEDCHEIIDAYKSATGALNDDAAKDFDPALYAFYGRYFQGTNGGLSFSTHDKGQHVFGFDMTSARNVPGFSALQMKIRQYLMDELHAKPHHGKTVPANVDYKKLYGKGYEDFMAALRRHLAKCNLEMMANPHLNPFFRHHLDLEASLEQKYEDDIVTAAEADTSNASTHELAQTVLDLFRAHDLDFESAESARELREALIALATEPVATPEKVLSGTPRIKFQPHMEHRKVLTGNPSTKWQPLVEHRMTDEAKDGELTIAPVKIKRGCCGIL